MHIPVYDETAHSQLSGLAEAGYYPGLQYMIGSWYRKDEMAKRACILNASGSIAMLFSGFLMAGLTGLGGRGGLPGWKWLVISLLLKHIWRPSCHAWLTHRLST